MTHARLPRLVATDLDGTLLRSDGSVSGRTREVLATLQERGVAVVIVTARPLRWMPSLWPLLGGRGYAVLSNGALVWDVARQRALEIRGLEAEPGLALVERIRARAPGAAFALELLSGPRAEPGYVPHADDVGRIDYLAGELAQLWDEPAVKILVQDEAGDPARLRRAVLEAVGETAVATWTMDGLMEVSAPGVTKALGLAGVAERLGVDQRDVVAFGDMPNDLPMLAWAGLSYAMANGDPTVVEAADRVAPRNDEDGVAESLAALFDL